jgi:hypothetical protein
LFLSRSVVSVIGEVTVVVSAILFFVVLGRGQMAERVEPEVYRFSVALHPPRRLPAALKGFGLWLTPMVGLTIVNYGFPIANLLATPGTAGEGPISVKIGHRPTPVSWSGLARPPTNSSISHEKSGVTGPASMMGRGPSQPSIAYFHAYGAKARHPCLYLDKQRRGCRRLSA